MRTLLSILIVGIAGLFFSYCKNQTAQSDPKDEQVELLTKEDSIRYEKLNAEGVKMIEIDGGYKVYTRKFGNSPIKVLLLHGGPALTHEYLECFRDIFAGEDVEFYEYDQLGSYYSDQPDDDNLWTIERFVEEVEQVRQGLGLNKDNFYLVGNSWGGILAMEYALKYQDNMKAMVVLNMTADFDKYEAYNAKLRSQMRQSLIDSLQAYEDAEDYHNPEYLDLVFNEYYTKHIYRADPEDWPEPIMRSFGHINQHVYEYMQGPSEFVPGGILKHWSVWDDLPTIEIPTLMVGAEHDTMNPDEMKEMATLVQNGRSLHCPNGSHLAMWDDQDFFKAGLMDFLYDVHSGEY